MRGLGEPHQHHDHDGELGGGQAADHGAVRVAVVEQVAHDQQADDAAERGAAAVSRPDALLRLPVGKSSVRYTASAGKAMPEIVAASTTANHIGGPPIEYERTTERRAGRNGRPR